MKGQFALFEAFILSLALSSLVALLAGTMYTASQISGAYNFNYGNLLYDFANALYKNATVSACFASGNYTCEHAFIKLLNSIYGIDYIRFSAENSTVSYGNESLCRRSMRECLPLRDNSSFSIACLYACGA